MEFSEESRASTDVRMYSFGFFGGSLPGMKVLQEGAWSNFLRRVGWGRTEGIEERELETLKVQTAGRPQNSGNMEMGQEKGRGPPEVRRGNKADRPFQILRLE